MRALRLRKAGAVAMEMTGEQRIAAPRRAVWDALNDPVVLRQCIPGCQSLERDGDNAFTALAEIRIGPIGARFKGTVTLSDIVAPDSYAIAGNGNGGIAGNARGRARVSLSDSPDGGTLVSYTVEAEVGGRMAQLGGPIIDATARTMADKFFTTFNQVVSGTNAPAQTGGARVTASNSTARQPAVASAGGIWGWIAALLATLFGGFVIGRSPLPGSLLLSVMAMLVIVAAAAFEAGRRNGGE